MMYVLFLISLRWDVSLEVCTSSHGFKCCAGTHWIEKTSTCERCPLGYHDTNCTKPCGYPFFGEDCQSECDCNYVKCDHIWGCSDLINNTTSSAFTLNSVSEKIKDTTPEQGLLPFTGESFFGNVLRYSLLCIAIVFVIFFGLFSGTYFYKHCVKQTFITNNRSDYQISNQQEGCNSHYHGRDLQRDNTIDPYYLEPVSNAHYEEVVNYVNPDDII